MIGVSFLTLQVMLGVQFDEQSLAKACGRMEYPNPTRKRGTILQVRRLPIGLRLVVLTSPLV